MLLALIIAFPLAGWLILGVVGGKLPRRVIGILACGTVALAFVASVAASRHSAVSAGGLSAPLFSWISVGTLAVPAGLLMDRLSSLMALVVTGVGFLIHVYSIGYMADDRSSARYFAYLNLFIASMLLLVLGSNLLVLFVGWELVGLCSYLLIGFWFDRERAAQAGRKAFVVNRIGDAGFLVGILLLATSTGTLEFGRIGALGSQMAPALLTAITLLLFVGATGKSAQLPLYVWLPDAMEGPTPVSALIHAATMVTAGVYMVVRSHAIFLNAPLAMQVVAIIGCATALFAATIGIAQTDIKKVLAYSTVSQLGYMFMACGVGAFSAGIFHLMTHAFFKGLLFLAAGSVIHGIGGEQDVRKMGGLRLYMPWTFATMTVATFAIAGFWPLAGFFSKDEILWMAYSSPHGSWVFWLIGVITAFITSFYMFRLWFMTFFGDYRGASAHDGHASRAGAPAPHGHEHGHGEPHESPWVMLGPLVILAVLSFVGGWVGIHHNFENFLAPVFHGAGRGRAVLLTGEEAAKIFEMERLEWSFTGISVAAALLGLLLAWRLYMKRPQLPQRIAASLGGIYRAVADKYYIDELYAVLFVKPVVDGSTTILWHGVDQEVIDATVNNSASAARHVSDNVRHMQSGNLRSYAGWVAAGGAVVIAYMVWMGVTH